MKIAIVGPESSGKTTLWLALQEYFPHFTFQPEFSRIYLEKNQLTFPYRHHTLQHVFDFHLKQQEQTWLDTNVIMDTDLTNYIIWFKWYYGVVQPNTYATWKAHLPNLYLLCYPDVPWSPDPLRESPTQRNNLFLEHVNLIQPVCRMEIIENPNPASRLKKAVSAIKNF
jgi:nicotinamide riboside kinase